jgi:two-component system sensor histidine kinase RpfC
MTWRMPPILRRFWRRIAPQRTDFLGREQGQALLRVAISVAVLTYLSVRHYPIPLDQTPPHWLAFLSAFLVVSVIVAMSAYRDRKTSVPRRLSANAMDIAAVSYLMASTPEEGAPLFVLYLWITLGNGFRFGVKPMVVSATLSVIGFTAVVASSDLWRVHMMLTVGVMTALVILPGYAAHLIRQLHKARERAEEASAAKGRFLARMSHELRTPLNSILGTTDILRNNRQQSKEDNDLLEVIQDSVSVSLRQIDNILDFSKLEAGKLQLDHAEFDLHELVNSTTRMVDPMARDKQLRVTVNISPEVPYLLVGDPHHLREILLNLLSNAVKFTNTGYVAVEVRLTDKDEQDALIHFEIRDTGIGIAPEALERIWESFSQEDTDTTRRYGGTGLGTTIAKQLVELMGGNIDVASLKGRGTAVWFSLPLRMQANPFGLSDKIAGARVLAVVAHPRSVAALQDVIDDIDGSVTFAGSVAEAASLYGRGVRLGNLWHLVLVDDRLATDAQRTHLAQSLTGKTTQMRTPVYLLSDTPPDLEELYAWGYTAALPSQLSSTVLARLIHASRHYSDEPAKPSAVVRVEPWAWGRDSKVTPRVLIADDNRTNRLILSQILESAGYDVESVGDGDAALDRLMAGGYKAAVLDMHMPGLDGVELLQQYRMLRPNSTVPMIMLTADATFGAKRDSADAGASAFLTKPAKSEVLLSTLERLIHDNEVRVLTPMLRPAAPERSDNRAPVLDLTVLAELDRLCRDPKKLTDVVTTFESEAVSLLDGIATAVGARDHSAYAEWVHALKGNAANVGAVKLVDACRQAEAAGVVTFRRDGLVLLQDLKERFTEVQLALHELVRPAAPPGNSKPH